MELGCLEESFQDSMTLHTNYLMVEVLLSCQRGEKLINQNKMCCFVNTEMLVTKGVQVELNGVSLLGNSWN